MLFDPELLWHFPMSARLAGLPSVLFILLSLGGGNEGRGATFLMLSGKVEWEKQVIGHG